MRTLYLTLRILSSFVSSYHPSPPPDDPNYPKPYHPKYISWTTGMGSLINVNNTGLLNISFPYYSNGVRQTFSGSVNNLYTNPSISVTILGVEFGNMRHFYTINLSPYTNTSTAVKLEIGTGYNFYLDILHNQTCRQVKKLLVIKPFINLAFAQHGTTGDNSNTFGTINNTNTNLNVLGTVAGPTYTVSSGHSSITDTAKNLVVYYRQNDWMVIPGISISNNPFPHTLHLQLICCYYLPLAEIAGIKLSQDKINPLGTVIPLSNPGITSVFNGQHTTSPYSFSGLYIGLSVGVNFSNDPSHHKVTRF